MRTKAAGAIGVVLFAAIVLAAANQVQAAREREYPLPPVEADGLYLTSPTALARLVGPYRTLAADLYWIRAIQYYGGAKRRLASRFLPLDPPPLLAANDSPEYVGLYQLLDITTSLDPYFDIAYRFGAVFLAEAFPSGAGRPDLAAKLLEKGLRARPDKWEYMEDIGFVHYWYGHDYRQAAAWFERAGKVDGAPNWLTPLAATTLAEGRDRRSSRLMWQAIMTSAGVDWLRAQAERHLLQFRALDEIELLQTMVDRLASKSGLPLTTWDAVIRADPKDEIIGIPTDPLGTHYELTPDGRVRLSAASGLFPLPAEPERRGPS